MDDPLAAAPWDGSKWSAQKNTNHPQSHKSWQCVSPLISEYGCWSTMPMACWIEAACTRILINKNLGLYKMKVSQRTMWTVLTILISPWTDAGLWTLKYPLPLKCEMFTLFRDSFCPFKCIFSFLEILARINQNVFTFLYTSLFLFPFSRNSRILLTL